MKVLITGATSAIAEATANLLAQQGHDFCLLARDLDRSETLKKHLLSSGAGRVENHPFDAQQVTACSSQIEALMDTWQGFDLAIFAHGVLGDQDSLNREPSELTKLLNINAVSTIVMVSALVNNMSETGHGQVLIIGSVAGDRGRKSNYAYGASKSILATFVDGLDHRFAGSAVNIMLVKPGMIDTPMTAHMEKGLLWATPSSVARDILSGLNKGKVVIYSPWYWRWILVIIRYLPRFIFNRLDL